MQFPDFLRPKFARSLVGRLALVNLLALLPLTVLVLIQVRDYEHRTLENQRRAAMAHTIASAQGQIKLISSAQTLARTVAALIPAVATDDESCNTLVGRTAASYPEYSLIGFVPMSGLMTCSSTGAPFDFAQTTFFEQLTSNAGSQEVLNRMGPVSHVPIIGTSEPVFDDEGTRLGIVTVSVPHEVAISPELDSYSRPVLDAPDALITFDIHGTELTSSIGLDHVTDHLPEGTDLKTLAQMGEQSFTALNGLGFTRIFSIVPITNDLLLLGSWEPKRSEVLLPPDLAPYLLVFLITISGLIAAAFAADKLVIRHVRSLGSAMNAFTAGGRGGEAPELDRPPSEIADLSESYGTMIATIQRDEAELENLLHEKEQLLREVHHRTGNSLQLIASILRMHLREAEDENVRSVLRHLLERIMSLSTVHLGLYKLAGNDGIASDWKSPT